jgi:alpha-tubulin suppressor-like RCC1 family protein
VKAIFAASGNSYAVTEDGSGWAWGDNTYAQIGDGTTTDRSFPTRVRDVTGNPFRNVIAAAGGGIHTLWLKDDGTVWAVGQNTNGSLGDGTQTSRSYPVRVEMATGVPLTGVIAIAASGNQSAALRFDGTVYRWGGGFNRPQQVLAMGMPLTGVVAMELGGGMTCLLNNGTLVSFTTIGSNPTQVFSSGNTPFAGVKAISAGSGFVLAQTIDGALWAWGSNNGQQLGDGTNTARANPVRVQGIAP